MDLRQQLQGYPRPKPAVPTFVRQSNPRPIAIVNPLQPQPVLTAQHVEEHFQINPSVFPPLGSSAAPPPSLPSKSEPKPEKSEARRALPSTPSDDEVDPGFNVYARPFVPKSLTIINSLVGQVVNTPPGRRIDFDTYVRSYIGLHFLPPVPQLDTISDATPSISRHESLNDNYSQGLKNYLEDEVQAQGKENDLYALYGHDVVLTSYVPGELATCSFNVPGLRENSPYVEEDDVVELRQIRYDLWKRPFGMDQWLAPVPPFLHYLPPGVPSVGGRSRGEPAPGWTNIIYNARVAAVQRKQEKLTLKVAGLGSGNLEYSMPPGSHTLKFNIKFPIQLDRYSPMLGVLPIIQKSLNYTQESLSLGDVQLDRRHWIKTMLEPSMESNELQTKLNPAFVTRPFFDRELNWEQKKAAESICRQNYGCLPFLISGPPGTGKTKTLVETALQLVHNVDKVSHILVCAPSDPAADTLVQRLSNHLKQSEILRLNRTSRTFGEVPDEVMRFCYISQDTFCLPAMKDLMSYKVVVTTCRDAVLLMYSRMTNADLYAAETGLLSALHPDYIPPEKVKLHWTALLMDEAAQALEPEALIPLAVVAPPMESIKLDFKPLIVMAGDEYQLGPRTSLRTSPLKISLFARLFGRSVYAEHPLARGQTGKPPPTLNSAMLPIHRPAFANLIRNYRSHPAILAVPSALFYKDTLEPEAPDTNRLAAWPGWKKPGWPVLFHNNTSADDLEADGGGWYNSGEAKIACKYAARLVKSGLLTQKEVCIMSPFKSQVVCLRKTIREPQFGSLWQVDIGPMEAFQGLERSVVILCTTRSKQHFVGKDRELDWGIIGMPNRMNVALTRAKFGLIVIGKREVLKEDPNWNVWLQFCDRNGLLEGETDGIHVTRHGELTRMEKVLISRERYENEDVENGMRQMGVYPQEDEMWTRGMAAALDVEEIDAALDLELGDEEHGDEEEGEEIGEDDGD